MPDFEIVDVDHYTLGLDRAERTLNGMADALADMHQPLTQVMDLFHEQTREWMDTLGDGSYDPLSPSTIANKARLGYHDPARPLYATGDLVESAAGGGPYGFHDVGVTEAWSTIDWERDGWNIPALHQEGVPWELVNRRAYTTREGRHVAATSYMWHLPARQIYHIDDSLPDLGADAIVDHVFRQVNL